MLDGNGGSMLNLYVGYNRQRLASDSCDPTTFQSPFGTLQLGMLPPMGWTNSVPIFHDNITHILQPEIPLTMVMNSIGIWVILTSG